MNKLIISLLFFFTTSSNFSCSTTNSVKINGISYVAPSQKPLTNDFQDVKNIEANYTAVTPYAFYDQEKMYFSFDSPTQWFGETKAGSTKTIEDAKKFDIKVMLKPHLWVKNQGWNGNLNLTSKEKKFFFQKYRDYILLYAKIAQEKNVEIYCIGVEFRAFAVENNSFFINLIQSVREIYTGKIVYAANWDYYDKISFWDKVDYISIDAYFPLLNTATPSVVDLKKQWIPISKKIELLSKKYHKKILFTEFGYRSINHCAWKQWELHDDWKYEGNTNLQAQANSFEAILAVFWKKDWFEGGFVWKWYTNNDQAGGENNNDYTPQNKPVLQILKKYYTQYK